MGLPEIKKELHLNIDQIDDQDFLMELNLLVNSRIGKPSPFRFNESQLKAIAESRKQVAQGQFYSHEEVMEEAEQWLNEK